MITFQERPDYQHIGPGYKCCFLKHNWIKNCGWHILSIIDSVICCVLVSLKLIQGNKASPSPLSVQHGGLHFRLDLSVFLSRGPCVDCIFQQDMIVLYLFYWLHVHVVTCNWSQQWLSSAVTKQKKRWSLLSWKYYLHTVNEWTKLTGQFPPL